MHVMVRFISGKRLIGDWDVELVSESWSGGLIGGIVSKPEGFCQKLKEAKFVVHYFISINGY